MTLPTGYMPISELVSRFAAYHHLSLRLDALNMAAAMSEEQRHGYDLLMNRMIGEVVHSMRRRWEMEAEAAKDADTFEPDDLVSHLEERRPVLIGIVARRLAQMEADEPDLLEAIVEATKDFPR